jgi:hypothetical protein
LITSLIDFSRVSKKSLSWCVGTASFCKQGCHYLDFRQSYLALTLPFNNAAATNNNQAKLFQGIQALSSVIPNVLLLQACCQARLPSRTHSKQIRIWHSSLLLVMPALPSKTAMPKYPERHAEIFSDVLLLQAKGLP